MDRRERLYFFCHGFGFSKGFWSPLSHFFPKERTIYLDFGDSAELDRLVPKLRRGDFACFGIGHSLGFVKLLEMEGQVEFQSLLGLNAFTNFFGYSPLLAGKRRREYEVFMRRFEVRPKATLSSFYGRCGLPEDVDRRAVFNESVSHEELHRLHSPRPLMNRRGVFVVNSRDDLIVPPAIAYDNFPPHSGVELSMMEGGGHVLGYRCAREIYEKCGEFFAWT